MGPYCQFCDHRCFVERIVNGRTVLMATCRSGMDHDRKQTGLDHTTAHNPRDITLAVSTDERTT